MLIYPSHIGFLFKILFKKISVPLLLEKKKKKVYSLQQIAEYSGVGGFSERPDC